MNDLANVKDVYNELKEGKNIIILDVRTEDEYDSGHIKNSILLPLNHLKEKATEIIQNKNAIINTICRSGGRSAMARSVLEDMGYTNVRSIAGGILKWQEQGLPVES
ncbi:rhodanese-like domain-containing protein [Candidatus Azambacteria bacterium]|nr:rhodanese-like domain-containing protein [Candidatus Azambacteria bacterium]